MEHTEYYQLSLWDADDRIMREDFNDNNAKLDTAVKAANDRIDTKADESAVTALQSALAGKADAATALTMDNLPYTIASYTGNGLDNQNGGVTVELGFRPRFIIISRGSQFSSSVTPLYIAGSHAKATTIFQFTDTGFRVFSSTYDANGINQSGLEYDFIAFR